VSRPRRHSPETELQRLKAHIAEVVTEREVLKRAIESGRLGAAEGLRRLEPLDNELSALDTAFKRDWDAQQFVAFD
jgi:hypothetical protein